MRRYRHTHSVLRFTRRISGLAIAAGTFMTVLVGEGDFPVIRDELSFFHNHTARDAGPTRRILCRRVRQILIVQLMDDEGAPVRIEQGVEPLGQGHPARDRIQRPFPVVAHREVLEIAEMVGMVP